MLKTSLKNLLKSNLRSSGLALLIGVLVLAAAGYGLQKKLIAVYDKQNSLIIKDRNERVVFIKPNENGYWAEYLNMVPPRFKELLLDKEDEYFYYHFGFNPSIYYTKRGIINKSRTFPIEQT